MNSIFIIFFTVTFLFCTHAFSYTSTMMNGDILIDQNYDINLEAQYIDETRDSGLNINGRFDTPFNDEMNLRAIVGFGDTDFHLGGFVKWIPIPDYHRQPALGLLAGLQYAKLNDLDEISLRASPYLSKAFPLDIGKLSPYLSVPIGISFIDGDTELPIQIQFGTELRVNEIEHFRFLAEIGVDLHKSFTYFSLGITFHFDSVHGMKFK